MLIAWATLGSLEKVRRNITSRPDFIEMHWKSLEGNGKGWTLKLLIVGSRHEECISYLVTQMVNMGVGVEKVKKN